ncbi:hypothetical protein B0T19DRAFT_16326 [Cercophora scortea]|uniref:Uncharacterized protein n=1 Tax=Cercophora scortea TaxID=314031 RepID=A0AAE0J2K2_9PEZI|nr:hypothetical protein B0T19DRAFT_16326 [Cercophora scortea]
MMIVSLPRYNPPTLPNRLHYIPTCPKYQLNSTTHDYAYLPKQHDSPFPLPESEEGKETTTASTSISGGHENCDYMLCSKQGRPETEWLQMMDDMDRRKETQGFWKGQKRKKKPPPPPPRTKAKKETKRKRKRGTDRSLRPSGFVLPENKIKLGVMISFLFSPRLVSSKIPMYWGFCARALSLSLCFFSPSRRRSQKPPLLSVFPRRHPSIHQSIPN